MRLYIKPEKGNSQHKIYWYSISKPERREALYLAQEHSTMTLASLNRDFST